MASDITLAVGDGARHMTYDELAQGRGILLASAPFVPRSISRNSAESPDVSDAAPTASGRIEPNGKSRSSVNWSSKHTSGSMGC